MPTKISHMQSDSKEFKEKNYNFFSLSNASGPIFHSEIALVCTHHQIANHFRMHGKLPADTVSIPISKSALPSPK